jgi:hypothetical protein
MGIINKLTSTITSTIDPNQLSPEEIEFLLNQLKTVTIIGEQVEMFYNLIIKLQNQYIEQTK